MDPRPDQRLKMPANESSSSTYNDDVRVPPSSRHTVLCLKDAKSLPKRSIPIVRRERRDSHFIIGIMLSAMTLALWLLPTTSVAKENFTTQCDSLPSLVVSLANDIGVIAASYVPTNSLNVSGAFNQVAFCRVNGSVPYLGNNTVFFEVWLPETVAYNERFLAVGGFQDHSLCPGRELIRRQAMAAWLVELTMPQW